jgi:hypothetical protein
MSGKIIKCIMCLEENIERELLKCSNCSGKAHESCVKVHLAFSAPAGQYSLRQWKCAKCAQGDESLSKFEYAHVMQTKVLNLSTTTAIDKLGEQMAKMMEDWSNKFIEQGKKIVELEKSQVEMKKDIESKDKIIEDLQVRMNEFEQRELALNLEIHNVPEMPNERLADVVGRIATALGAPDTMQGISNAYRSRQIKGKPRAIAVQFNNAAARLKWLKGRGQKEFRNFNLPVQYADVAAAGGAVASKQPKDKQAHPPDAIRVFEQLTFANRQLLFETRQAAFKDKKFESVWTYSGKIYARKNADAVKIRIRNKSDIITKIEMNNERESDETRAKTLSND